MKYKVLLFDLDGTLTDSGLGITKAVSYSLEKFGIKEIDRKKLNVFIGPPLSQSFSLYYHFDELQTNLAIKYFREYYQEIGIYENEVYPDIDGLLNRLKEQGHTLIVATSKPEVLAKKVLDHFGLTKYFDDIVGATMDSTREKKGDVIAYALKKNNVVNKDDILMIGDRNQDCYGAKENNIDVLGVLYGYGDLKELHDANATYIANSVLDILNYV